MKHNDIVVTLEGGLVMGVSVGDDRLRAILGKANIVDYDAEGADPDEIIMVDQVDGTSVEAVGHCQEIGRPGISIDDDAF